MASSTETSRCAGGRSALKAYIKENGYVAPLSHLMAYQAGEWRDPESSMPHLWHVATNAAFLVALEEEE